MDFTKAEEIIRKISKINKHPMSKEARLVPVQVIKVSFLLKSLTFFINFLMFIFRIVIYLNWVHFGRFGNLVY